MNLTALGDLVDAGIAELQTGPFGTQLKAAEYTSHGTPVINVRNVGFGDVRTDQLEHVGPETRDRLAQHLLRSDDIVFGRKGAVERHAFLREEHDGWMQGSDCIRLRLDVEGPLVPRFVSYYLSTPRHKQWMINQSSHGATMASLNQAILRRLTIPTPPIELQRKVAAFLATYDELIENNLRRIEILEEMAQAIYRKWFVNFHYPGHEADELADSPHGPVPGGWELTQLGELADVNAVSIRKGSAPAEINYIDISSVSPRSVDAIRTMPFEGSPSRARRVVRSGDTIWSSVRPNRRSFALVLDPPENTVASTGFVVLTPTAAPYSYVYGAVGTGEFAAYLTNHAKGAAYPAVAAEDFEKASMIRPPEHLLVAFHDRVAPMLELVRVLAAMNHNLRLARDLLLPRLVSGDLDVSGLDIDTSWLVA